MARPLIGLTGGRVFGRDIARNLDVLGDSPVDIFYADYSQAVIAAGGIPVFLPLDLDPADAVEKLDGLLMTGGDDIAPDRYGAELEAHTHAPEPTHATRTSWHSSIVLSNEQCRRSGSVEACNW